MNQSWITVLQGSVIQKCAVFQSNADVTAALILGFFAGCMTAVIFYDLSTIRRNSGNK